MSRTKFTMMLVGPAGSGKSTYVAGMSEIDIYSLISAKEGGGANTTKLTVLYEFNSINKELNVVDCTPIGDVSRHEVLDELNQLILQEDGREQLFNKINSESFSKICSTVSLSLPIKNGFFPDNVVFDSVVLIDSRGLGDVEKGEKIEFKIDELGITSDVNAILFFSISSIQQPAVFSEIIDEVQKTNLKTPMFLLRRDADLTKNDQNFKETIERNIKASDPDLYNAVSVIDDTHYTNKLNDFVFNVPEVKVWKGAINVETERTRVEKEKYYLAIKEVLSYSIEMYNELYSIIANKLNVEYQELFTREVLNQLTSEKALRIVSGITSNPHSKPSYDFEIDRDTEALSKPPKLNRSIGIEPFMYEKSSRGNQYSYGTIPSYSYSCVNFREVFRRVTRVLTKNYKLSPLFNTFMDVVLSDYTTTAYTGYTFASSRQNAFHFDKFLNVREDCTNFLSRYDLVVNENEWKTFTYNPNNEKYSYNEAIAVLVYLKLVESLNLANSFEKYKELEISDKCIDYVVENDNTKIKKKLSRSS